MKKSHLFIISICSLCLLNACGGGGGGIVPPSPPPPPPATPSSVPLINQALSPAAAAPGGAAFTLTVNGTGFVSGSTVKWNGNARTTSFVSASQLTANIPASDIASTNTALVTVVNPTPGGGTSNAAFFETTRPTSSVSWSVTSALASGTGPSSVATEDFNGDGKLDLIVTNSGSNNISVLLGNGDGTFQPAVNYPAGTTPNSVAVGDFNGDGKLDLAVANRASNDISIFLGKGDGTFQAAVNYPAGTNPNSVAAGDFNGDGKLDLAVANNGSLNVSVLLGNGDGTFKTAVDYGAGSNPSSVAVGDFNGDGKLDLAVANANSSGFGNGNVSILLGNGDGTFQAAVNYNAGTNPSSVAVADFNGDGKLDLAVGNADILNFGVGGISILLGNGDGTFKTAVDYGGWAGSLAAADFNGDGKLDLAATNGTSVSVLLGNGDGTFQPPLDYAPGGHFGVGDFNGDGRLDLAVAGSTVSVLLQPGLSGPNATLAPTTLTFVTEIVGTTSPAQSVQLSNNGTTTLNITSIASSSTNFGETDNCGSSLVAGASCNISVSFAPGAIDNLIGTLTITDNAPGSPHTVSLTGVGTVVKLVPASMDFQCAPLCGSKIATLTNTGVTTLTISNITITSNKKAPADHGGFGQMNNCPASLGAGQSCSITVSFIGAFDFSYIGSLIVNDNGGGGGQIVSLRGFAH